MALYCVELRQLIYPVKEESRLIHRHMNLLSEDLRTAAEDAKEIWPSMKVSGITRWTDCAAKQIADNPKERVYRRQHHQALGMFGSYASLLDKDAPIKSNDKMEEHWYASWVCAAEDCRYKQAHRIMAAYYVGVPIKSFYGLDMEEWDTFEIEYKSRGLPPLSVPQHKTL